MCCCEKPTINGEPGYSWDGKETFTRRPSPPELAEGDVLIYDEPGRCGGLDSHCHHFRIVKHYNIYYLLVQHGGGPERIQLGGDAWPGVKVFDQLNSHDRYWIIQLFYHAQKRQTSDAIEKERAVWQRAAANKRIKTRKMPKSDRVKVWIEEPTVLERV